MWQASSWGLLPTTLLNHTMKLISLLGAAMLATAPAPAVAQGTSLYAKAFAWQICTYMRQGMTHNQASQRAIKELFPVFGHDLARAGYDYAARQVVAERLILCGEL